MFFSSLKHMKPYFQTLKGGLFETVNKADVGDNSEKMKENGVAMLSWADPFFPDDKLDKDDIKMMLDKEKVNCKYNTAPACGLYLVNVYY